VREAMFSMIGQDLTGLGILDAFGGSGLLAAEAWSRGGDVTIVERSAKQVAAIRAAASALGATWTIVRGDCISLAPRLGTFDVVLADPPYAMVSDELVERLAVCVGARLMLESHRDTELGDAIGGMTRIRRKRYGNTSVHLYER